MKIKIIQDQLQVYQEEKLQEIWQTVVHQICTVCWLDLYLCEDVYEAVNIFNNKITEQPKTDEDQGRAAQANLWNKIRGRLG